MSWVLAWMHRGSPMQSCHRRMFQWIGGGGRGVKKNFPSAHRMLKLKGLVGSLQARVLDKRI